MRKKKYKRAWMERLKKRSGSNGVVKFEKFTQKKTNEVLL